MANPILVTGAAGRVCLRMPAFNKSDFDLGERSNSLML
jgi:hypothetical protein